MDDLEGRNCLVNQVLYHIWIQRIELYAMDEAYDVALMSWLPTGTGGDFGEGAF